MRILVTNDDGVAAPGLAVAEAIARDVAGADGEIWVVAPAFEQSGVGHAISYNAPIQVEQLEERRFAVSGTPADCVILARSAFMAEARPDLVISGVNRGHNIAEDAIYSGTVGGAIEGALQGLRSIALSQYYRRPKNASSNAPPSAAADVVFDAARGYGASVVRRLLTAEWSKDLFFNVNFPPIASDEVKGVQFARQGRRSGAAFDAVERLSPGGRRYFWLQHAVDNLSGAPEDDSTLCASGWVTIVPMRPNLTQWDALDAIASDRSADEADGPRERN